jgi:hypothetical protein
MLASRGLEIGRMGLGHIRALNQFNADLCSKIDLLCISIN